jgi:hypothetical protein
VLRCDDMIVYALRYFLISFLPLFGLPPNQSAPQSECNGNLCLQVYSNADFIEEAGDVIGYELAFEPRSGKSIKAQLYIYQGEPNTDGIDVSGHFSDGKVMMEGKWIQHLVEEPSNKEIIESQPVEITGTLDPKWFRGIIRVSGHAEKVTLKRTDRTWLPQLRTIPQEIWGKWVVIREIPTDTITCWSDAAAKKLLGTEISYSGEVFRWKEVVANRPVAETRIISAEQFHKDNSGQGSNSSQITFGQLGIQAEQVMQISIQHPPGEITGATIEIPGDEVLVKDKDTIIFAACNVYFEAKRIQTSSSAR